MAATNGAQVILEFSKNETVNDLKLIVTELNVQVTSVTVGDIITCSHFILQTVPDNGVNVLMTFIISHVDNILVTNDASPFLCVSGQLDM